MGDEVERRHVGELDLGDDAEYADAEPSEIEHLRRGLGGQLVLGPVGGEEGEAGDHPGEPGVAEAGAVGAGRDRPGERLRVDVALIGERETVGGEEAGNVAQPGAGAQPDPLVCGIDGDDAGERIERDHRSGSERHGGERVPGPDDADAAPLLDGGGDAGRELRLVGGGEEVDRVGVRGARPRAHPPSGSRAGRPARASASCVGSSSVSGLRAPIPALQCVHPDPRYVGHVATTVPPSTTWYSVRCSASSPAFA